MTHMALGVAYDGGQKTGVRSQKSEVRSQKTEVVAEAGNQGERGWRADDG